MDPHFAALYARREEERLAESLAARLRDRASSEAASAALLRERQEAAGTLERLE
jgi:hypothetical protein